MSDTKAEKFDAKAFLASVGEGKSVAKYRKRQAVFKQGDEADAVYFVQVGKVKVSVISDLGKEAVVALLGEGNFFGEGCLAGQPLRMATVTAVEESDIVRIDKSTIIDMLRQDPVFSGHFIAHLLARSIRVEEDLIDQLFNSSEKRLARVLLLLANFGKGDSKPTPIIAKVSHELLAEMIGTTRSRISFFMNKFRRLGFITYNGTLEIHNSLLSVVLHDQAAGEGGTSAPPEAPLSATLGAKALLAK